MHHTYEEDMHSDAWLAMLSSVASKEVAQTRIPSYSITMLVIIRNMHVYTPSVVITRIAT